MTKPNRKSKPMSDIRLYMHCRKCLRANVRGQNIEVGITHDNRIQVWCKTHDCAVATIGPDDFANFGQCGCAECQQRPQH